MTCRECIACGAPFQCSGRYAGRGAKCRHCRRELTPGISRKYRALQCLICGERGHRKQTCKILGAFLHDRLKAQADVVDLILRRLCEFSWNKIRFDQILTCASFGPGGDVLSIGTADGSIHLHDAQTAERILSISKGHARDNLECKCQFYSDGRFRKRRPNCLVAGHSHRYFPDPLVTNVLSLHINRLIKLITHRIQFAV